MIYMDLYGPLDITATNKIHPFFPLIFQPLPTFSRTQQIRLGDSHWIHWCRHCRATNLGDRLINPPWGFIYPWKKDSINKGGMSLSLWV